jgi:predicted MFS family arabinose efflux permease
MAAGGCVAALGLATAGLDVMWATQMASMVVLGFGFFLLHNSVQTEVTELAPTARASAFSLHAFSFFLGQAVGPIAYGAALPVLGAATSFGGGAVILAVTGMAAGTLLRSPPGRST